jgi:8-oxo-dGTP pyrophosphatase MutT (NUDIX family)
MRREFSAGGALVKEVDGRLCVAAIRPQGKRAGHWALPKGAPDAGETMQQTALREVLEETGLRGEVLAKLGSVRYVYTWEGERVFKVVTFFLMRYLEGELGDIAPEMRVEVHETTWLPLEEAPRALAYRGEQETARKAAAALAEHAL